MEGFKILHEIRQLAQNFRNQNNIFKLFILFTIKGLDISEKICTKND